MASVNKVILLGNLGRDPEVIMTASGQKMAKFSIATSEKYLDKSGAKQEKTEWHNILAWGKLADIIEQYVRKGSSVYIEGKLQTSSWEDPNGQKRFKTEIVARELQMLGGRGEQCGEPDRPPRERASKAKLEGYSETPADDDLPF